MKKEKSVKKLLEDIEKNSKKFKKFLETDKEEVIIPVKAVKKEETFEDIVRRIKAKSKEVLGT